MGFMTGYWRALLSLLFLFSVTLGLEAEIQAVLSGGSQIPDPDGKVQVYVLAGQSNMVGFGYLQDAPPVYPSVYLSADPSIKEGEDARWAIWSSEAWFVSRGRDRMRYQEALHRSTRAYSMKIEIMRRWNLYRRRRSTLGQSGKIYLP